MKLTKSQHSTIGKLILKNVTYLETYQEVYDHVLSELENRAELVDIETEVLQILHDDFGGLIGLYEIEQYQDKTVSWNILRQYIRHLIIFFSWPGMLVTILLVVVGYFDIYIVWPIWLVAMFLFSMFLLPWFYIAFTNFTNGLAGKGPRKSIFVNKMWKIASLPIQIFFYGQMFTDYVKGG